MGLQFARIGGEADDVEVVAGILGGDEVVQCQGDLFRRLERASECHGPGLVHEHGGRGRSPKFRPIDLEVFRLQAHRHRRPLAVDGVPDGARHMQVEWVAILVRLGLFQAVAEAPLFRQRVATETLPPQPRVDLAERLLADHARAPGSEFPPVSVADVSRVAQRLQEFLEIVERISGVFVQQVAKRILVDTFDIAASFRLAHLFDELVQVAHLAHEPHRGFEIKFLSAAEYVTLTLGVEEVHFLRELDEFGLELRVAKAVRHQ